MVYSIRSLIETVRSKFYARSGEPYRIDGQLLRFVCGTRPVRLKYANSANLVNRYDALELKTLMSGVRCGQTVFDVGANAGQYAIVMAALVGSSGRVVAFEPDPAALELLQRNVSLNPGIKPPKIEPLAMSDSSGFTKFYVDAHSSANSSLAAASFAPKELRELQVPTTTLDKYVEGQGAVPDWVKIDTEGAEIAILRGARDLLKTDAKFLVELHPYAWADFGVGFEELVDIVRVSGRTMRYLDREEELRADPTYGVVSLDRLL